MPSWRVLVHRDRGDKARTTGRQMIGSERCHGEMWNKGSEIFRISHGRFYAVDRCWHDRWFTWCVRTYVHELVFFPSRENASFPSEAYSRGFGGVRFARISRANLDAVFSLAGTFLLSASLVSSLPPHFYVVYLLLKSPFENGCHFACCCIDRYN